MKQTPYRIILLEFHDIALLSWCKNFCTILSHGRLFTSELMCLYEVTLAGCVVMISCSKTRRKLQSDGTTLENNRANDCEPTRGEPTEELEIFIEPFEWIPLSLTKRYQNVRNAHSNFGMINLFQNSLLIHINAHHRSDCDISLTLQTVLILRPHRSDCHTSRDTSDSSQTSSITFSDTVHTVLINRHHHVVIRHWHSKQF